MNFKPFALWGCALLLGLSSTAWAGFSDEEAEWKESEAPPPPAFDGGRLVVFEGSPGSSLVYGVDPASISISKADGLVRYVVVASSASGARNVMYEAIRCATGEFKTYARYSPEGQWRMVGNPEWRSMFGSMPSNHALRLAKAGAWDNASLPTSVNQLVRQLKNPAY